MFLDAILLELNTAVIALRKGNLNRFLKEGNIYMNTHVNRECSYKRPVSILPQKIWPNSQTLPGSNGWQILIFHSKATMFEIHWLSISQFAEYVSTVCSNKASPIGTVLLCFLLLTFLLDSSLPFYICSRKHASPCFKTLKKNNGMRK